MAAPLTLVTRNEANNLKSTWESIKMKLHEIFLANTSNHHERSTKFLFHSSIFSFSRIQSLRLLPKIAKIESCQARIYHSIIIKVHTKEIQIQDFLIYSYLLFSLLLLFVVEAQQYDSVPGCPTLSTIANADSYNGSFCFCNVRDRDSVDIACLYSSTVEQFKAALSAASAAKKTIKQVGLFFPKSGRTNRNNHIYVLK